MKLVLMIESGSEGIFDVFHVLTVPAEMLPPGFAERWRSIINASPIQPLITYGKENLAVNSIYDPDTTLFTMGEDMPQIAAKPVDQKNAVFMINNLVYGIASMPQNSNFYQAAYSSPVTVIEVEDDFQVEVGWTWDGTNFYPIDL